MTKPLGYHLGESQQTFSNRLGVTVRAVAGYEAGWIPDTLILLDLVVIAWETGAYPLAVPFIEILKHAAYSHPAVRKLLKDL